MHSEELDAVSLICKSALELSLSTVLRVIFLVLFGVLTFSRDMVAVMLLLFAGIPALLASTLLKKNGMGRTICVDSCGVHVREYRIIKFTLRAITVLSFSWQQIRDITVLERNGKDGIAILSVQIWGPSLLRQKAGYGPYVQIRIPGRAEGINDALDIIAKHASSVTRKLTK